MADKLVLAVQNQFLGHEIARLAVASGREVTCIDAAGRPETKDPWVEGVRWVERDPSRPEKWTGELKGANALVLVPSERAAGLDSSSWSRLAEEAKTQGVPKFVVVRSATKTGRGAASLPQSGKGMTSVLLEPELIYGPGRATTPAARDAEANGRARAARVEKVAMATLRAAVEPDVEGTLNHDAVEELGDAMMIQ